MILESQLGFWQLQVLESLRPVFHEISKLGNIGVIALQTDFRSRLDQLIQKG